MKKAQLLLILCFILIFLFVFSCEQKTINDETKEVDKDMKDLYKLSEIINEDKQDPKEVFDRLSDYNVDLSSIDVYDPERFVFFQCAPSGYLSSGIDIPTLAHLNNYFPVQHVEVIDDNTVAAVVKMSLSSSELSKEYVNKRIKELSCGLLSYDFEKTEQYDSAFVFIIFKKHGNGDNFITWKRTGETYVLNEVKTERDYSSIKTGDPAEMILKHDPFAFYNMFVLSSTEELRFISVEESLKIKSDDAVRKIRFQRPLDNGIIEFRVSVDNEAEKAEIIEITLYPYGDENNPDRFTLPNADVFKCLEGN